MDPRHAILFEPIQIGPKTLPNRFYQVPHASGFGTGKPWSQAAFRGMKAEGGWGAVCTEYAPIASDADELPAVGANFWDDDDAAALQLMVDVVHANGALAGIELYHGGARSTNNQSRRPLIAPSAIPDEHRPYSVPKEMEQFDIDRLLGQYRDAARRAKDVGFDIVYAYAAHAYLPVQFLAPYFNKRTDSYGGSLANRARFWLESITAIREGVGSDVAVAARLTVDSLGSPGIAVEESLQIVGMADPFIDLWDVNVGSWPQDSGTSRYFREGYQLEWTSQVRAMTAKPILGVGRYSNPDLMADIVRSGALDIIGSARQAMADPFLPRKVAEGRLDEIRECTGSNVCILKEETFAHIGCVQNPTVGEEHRRGWHPELYPPTDNPDRSVLVVGAGPAGMECAIVLAKRGFAAVHIVDAADEIGGRLRWTRRLPTIGDWGRIVDYRKIQLDKLANVEVITGRELSAADVLDYGADLVVIATGSHWATDGLQYPTHEVIEGADAALPYVLTPEQIMLDGKRPTGNNIIVYDVDAYAVGIGIAEALCDLGHQVCIVTPSPVVSPVADLTLEAEFVRLHLHERGIKVVTGVVITEVSQSAATGYDEYGEAWSGPCDSVVLVTQQVADAALYLELVGAPEALAAAGITGLYRIGDALAPRMISEAVFDGHRMGMEIDSADPNVPLPYDRERRFPGDPGAPTWPRGVTVQRPA